MFHQRHRHICRLVIHNTRVAVKTAHGVREYSPLLLSPDKSANTGGKWVPMRTAQQVWGQRIIARVWMRDDASQHKIRFYLRSEAGENVLLLLLFKSWKTLRGFKCRKQVPVRTTPAGTGTEGRGWFPGGQFLGEGYKHARTNT